MDFKSADELNKRFVGYEYAQIMQTKEMKDGCIGGVVCKLLDIVGVDEYGGNIYKVEIKQSSFPVSIIELSVSNMNPIDIDKIVWNFNTLLYWSSNQL